MPIYEYACPDCGYQGEHLQKLADTPITACPKCTSTQYFKKISAAGFALKGTGWYVTDFRGGANAAAANPSAETAGAPAPAVEPSATPATTPAPNPAPAPTPPASPAV